MRTRIKILLLLIISISVNAQQSNPDSLKQALKNASTDSARYSISIGLDNYYTEINRDSALQYAEEALYLAQKNNRQLDVAEALISKSYSLMHLGKFSESYQCLSQSLKIQEKPESENKSWDIQSSTTASNERLTKLRWTFAFGFLMGDVGKKDLEIAQYKEAKKIAEEIGDTGGLAGADMNLGITYLGLGQLDSALAMSENAKRIYTKKGYKKYLGGVYLDIGNNYLRRQNKTMAVEYFHAAIKSDNEQNNISGLNEAYSSLSDFYLKESNKDSSLYYASKNLSTLQSMGSKNLSGAYSNLSASYELNNKIDSAYKYKALALIYTDSTYKARIENLTKVQNQSFDDQLKLQELEKEKADTRNKIRTYAMLAALGVFLAIGLILYLNNRQKQKANKVLETILTNLKSTQSQLIQSEKMASLGELTAGIAHEIQNPLNFVNNFSEVNRELIQELKNEIMSDNKQEAISIANNLDNNEEKINHHGRRADAIVKGMLQHSRSSTGLKESTDVNALADEFLRLSYHGLRAKDKDFNSNMNTDFDGSIGNVSIIPQDIGRVLLNLYNNAFYAVGEKKKQQPDGYDPTVSVSTKRISDKVEIKVKDNGNGIPQKVVDKIFQPFFTTKPAGVGTGLGLSLSYDIIKAHGGEILVKSKESEGSEFIVTLPV